MPPSPLRRSLLKRLAEVAAMAALWPPRHSHAAELPHLDPRDPAALALAYVEEAGQVDIRKQPTYVKGSNCENCLQLQGKTGESYRPCALFPQKSVHLSGWCSGWTAEM